MIPFKNMVKKGENFSNVDISDACNYAAEDALYTYKLYYALLEDFKDKECEHLIKIAHDIEFEFTYVLAHMEDNV